MAKANRITPTPSVKPKSSAAASLDSVASLKVNSGLYRAGTENSVVVINRGYGAGRDGCNGYLVENTGGKVSFCAPHEVRTMDGEPTHVRLAYESHPGYLAPRTDNNFPLVKECVASFHRLQSCTIYAEHRNVVSLNYVLGCLEAGFAKGGAQ